MRRSLLVTALALALGAFLAVVPTNFTPQQAAHAFCASSTDPRCAGANLPILLDAGIAVAGAVPGTSTPLGVPGTPDGPPRTTTSTPTRGVVGLVLSAAAIAAGMFAADSLQSSVGGWIDGLLKQDGFDGSVATLGDGWLSGGCPTFQLPSRDMTGALRTAYVNEQWAPQRADCPVFSDLVRRSDHRVEANSTVTVTLAGVLATAATVDIHVVDHWTGTNRNVPYTVTLVCQTGTGALSDHVIVSSTGIWSGTYSASCPTGRTTWAVHASYIQGHGSNSDPWTYVLLWKDTGAVAPGGLATGSIQIDVTCRSANGDRLVSVTTPFEQAPGTDLSLPEAKCLPSEVAVGIEGWVTHNGQTYPLFEPTTVNPLLAGAPIEYPDCFDGSRVCVVELQQRSGSTWVTCGSIGQFCMDWARTDTSVIADQYRCVYGSHVLTLDHCSMYRAPAVGPLPNYNPDTGELHKPGDPVPNREFPSPKPETNAGTQAPPAPAPSPGGLPDFGVDPSNCWPTGWGVLNPVAWVLMPVQCALSWAFVPRPQAVEALQLEFMARADATLAGSPIEALATIPALFTQPGGGCAGPPLHINMLGVNYTGYPFNACDEPMAGAAALVRSFASVSIYFLAGFAIIRYFSSVFGFVQFGGSTTSTAKGGKDSD